MATVIEFKELSDNVRQYAARVRRGESFVVKKQSKPVFKITAVDATEDQWEEIIDFREIKKGGVKLSDLLERL